MPESPNGLSACGEIIGASSDEKCRYINHLRKVVEGSVVDSAENKVDNVLKKKIDQSQRRKATTEYFLDVLRIIGPVRIVND